MLTFTSVAEFGLFERHKERCPHHPRTPQAVANISSSHLEAEQLKMGNVGTRLFF